MCVCVCLCFCVCVCVSPDQLNIEISASYGSQNEPILTQVLTLVSNLWGLSNKLLIEGVITIQDIWGMSENENILY